MPHPCRPADFTCTAQLTFRPGSSDWYWHSLSKGDHSRLYFNRRTGYGSTESHCIDLMPKIGQEIHPFSVDYKIINDTTPAGPTPAELEAAYKCIAQLERENTTLGKEVATLKAALETLKKDFRDSFREQGVASPPTTIGSK